MKKLLGTAILAASVLVLAPAASASTYDPTYRPEGPPIRAWQTDAATSAWGWR